MCSTNIKILWWIKRRRMEIEVQIREGINSIANFIKQEMKAAIATNDIEIIIATEERLSDAFDKLDELQNKLNK